jgi:hypothetical protein
MNTTVLDLTLLEVGQKEKEITINTNFELIDSKVIRFLGDLASAPVTSGIPPGSMYFNTTTSKINILRENLTWVQIG